MLNFFYTDLNGKKQGPFSDEQLKELATRGIITPSTLIVTEQGQDIARNVPGLFAPAPSVDDAISSWIKALLNLGKTNRLIHCKFEGRSSSLELHPVDFESFVQDFVIDGKPMSFPWKENLEEPNTVDGNDVFEKPEKKRPVSYYIPLIDKKKDILSDLPDKDLGAKLKRFSQDARISQSERGVNILFVTVGLLKWYESETSNEEIFSPIILVPAVLQQSALGACWKLERYNDEIVHNQSLWKKLESDFSLKLPEIPEMQNYSEVKSFLNKIEETISPSTNVNFTRSVIEDRCVLGCFDFQKMAMVKDLEENREKIANHLICRIIAGDNTAEIPLKDNIEPHNLDDTLHPRDVYSVLDADSSQQAAIQAVLSDTSIILDGPPGTGKSQTIANIIAEMLAKKKTVLFVSEKTTALEVVKRRLEEVNLGDFCLDAHAMRTGKRAIIDELDRCLRIPVESDDDTPNRLKELEDLHRKRRELNAYVKSLHKQYGDLRITPFQAHGRYLKYGSYLSYNLNRTFQSRHGNPLAIDIAKLTEMQSYFRDLANSPVTGKALTHPWQGCLLSHAAWELQQIKSDFQDLANEIRQLNLTVKKLEEFDIIPTNSSINSLHGAICRIKPFFENPNYVVVPKEWFSLSVENVKPVLGKVGELANEYNGIRSMLTNFEWNFERYFVSPNENDIVNDFRFLDNTWEIPRQIKSRFKKQYPHTISEEKQTLQALLKDITDIITKVAAIAQVQIPNEFGVGVKPDTLRLQQINDYSEWARLTSELPILPKSWLASRSEEKIRGIFTMLSELNKSHKSFIKQLRSITPTAFRSKGTKRIIQDGFGFNSFWKRTLGRVSGTWKKWLSEVSTLYTDNLPPLKQVFSDMELLKQCFELQEQLRQYKRDNQNYLISDIKNAKDLYEKTTALRQKMEELFPVSNIDRLKNILTDNEEKIAFFPKADKLYEAIQDLYSKIQTASQLFIINIIQNADKDYREETLALYRKFLLAIKAALEKRIQTLKQVEGLTEKNLSHQQLQDIHEKIKSLSESLKQLHSSKEQLEKYLSEKFPINFRSFPVDFKNSQLNRQIEVYSRLVDIYRNGITPRNRLLATSQNDYDVIRSYVGKISDYYENPNSRGKRYWDRLKRIFPTDSRVSTGVVLGNLTLEKLADWLEERANDIHKLDDWIRYKQLVKNLEENGLGDWVNELNDSVIDPQKVEHAFLFSFYRDWISAVDSREVHLRGFNKEFHTQKIRDFQRLDKNSFHGVRVRVKLLNSKTRPHSAAIDVAPPNSPLGILKREINKKKNLLPTRQLFQKIPDLIKQIKPCVMMSPLSVSSYLQDFTFDLVIFDEASQIRPHDAIGAIYRGKQVVIAGDNKQLPPTDFFESLGDTGDTSDTDGDNDSIADFESILDVCLARLPRKRLLWHYRSRREGLIAYSNHHFYNNELLTFPSIFDGIDAAVKYHCVSNGVWNRGIGNNPIEAQEVAKLVFKHFEENPTKSLGVITLNQKQRDEVNTEIEKILRNKPEMEPFFDESKVNPFFVKNLEIVQGDERDCIIISVGYGYNQSGKMLLNFGPINKQGGERRLNVAVTRAKYNVTLVSSIHYSDIVTDSSRSRSVGAKLLRAYLEYAETGMLDAETEIRRAQGQDECDSPFEEEVSKALREAGFVVKHQVGCSGYYIDMVLVDPERPERYVLGIECDGATYHQSATARDRDRLRQNVLEGLGWTIHRIWSTDWAKSPERQVEEVRKAYNLAKIKLEQLEE